MVKLIKSLLNAFLYDELAARRWIRGALGAAATVGVQLVIDPAWSTLSGRQLAVRAVPPILAFAHGAMQSSAKKADGTTAAPPAP